MQNQRILTTPPQKKITHKNKVAIQEANYSNDYVLDTAIACLAYNMKWKIFQHRFLKLSILVSHKRHGHKNTLPFRNFIASATGYLSFLIFFSNCNETTMATNIMDGTGNSIPGNDIASETAYAQWLVQKRKDILNLKEFLRLEKHQGEGLNLFKELRVMVKPSLIRW